MNAFSNNNISENLMKLDATYLIHFSLQLYILAYNNDSDMHRNYPIRESPKAMILCHI